LSVVFILLRRIFMVSTSKKVAAVVVVWLAVFAVRWFRQLQQDDTPW
jgi:hypothetical protein